MVVTPKNSPYVLGIDLGTSNSAIALLSKGRSEILSIEQEKMCPSVVSIRKGVETSEVLVGRGARKRLMIDPDNTVASIKREMGTDWKKTFAVQPDKQYTPIDISAEILSKLVNEATQDSERLRGTPRYAVICIPANFNDAQKTATQEAAKLANLEVLYLLEEPVAAAIAYGAEKERDQTILVYDLGGGTFDVCVLKIDSTENANGKYQILAKEGIAKLGGDDFDAEIMKIAAKKFEEYSNIDILDLKKEQGISVSKIRQAQQRLKEAAEVAKQDLSASKTAQISLPDLIADEAGTPYSLEMEITREEFEATIQPLILQSKQAIEHALEQARLTAEDLDRIILIGGSTRIPLVRTMLKEMFGREPYSDTDPDTAVARGAAIFGANLGVPTDQLGATESLDPGDKYTGSIEIKNIVSHYLGIEVANCKFSCVLEKDAQIPQDAPLVAQKEYTTQRDEMTELVIRIYQSLERVETVHAEGVECIGEFFLTGIPPAPKGQERITVSFEIDQQNLLRVRAVSFGTSTELDITRS